MPAIILYELSNKQNSRHIDYIEWAHAIFFKANVYIPIK